MSSNEIKETGAMYFAQCVARCVDQVFLYYYVVVGLGVVV